MYKTYSYNDMPMQVKSSAPTQKPPEKKEDAPKEISKPKEENKGILDGLEKDDIILIAVVLILLMDGCDDKLLLLAVGFILVSEWL